MGDERLGALLGRLVENPAEEALGDVAGKGVLRPAEEAAVEIEAGRADAVGSIGHHVEGNHGPKRIARGAEAVGEIVATGHRRAVTFEVEPGEEFRCALGGKLTGRLGGSGRRGGRLAMEEGTQGTEHGGQYSRPCGGVMASLVGPGRASRPGHGGRGVGNASPIGFCLPAEGAPEDRLRPRARQRLQGAPTCRLIPASAGMTEGVRWGTASNSVRARPRAGSPEYAGAWD